MGATHVTVTIRNPAQPDKTWEALFLVDTGATDSMAPRKHLEAIGLEPRGRRIYELADGSEHILEVTVAEIEFMGEIVGGTVIMGEEDAEPLLGVTALESVGIEVDPVNQRLKRLPAVAEGCAVGGDVDGGKRDAKRTLSSASIAGRKAHDGWGSVPAAAPAIRWWRRRCRRS